MKYTIKNFLFFSIAFTLAWVPTAFAQPNTYSSVGCNIGVDLTGSAFCRTPGFETQWRLFNNTSDTKIVSTFAYYSNGSSGLYSSNEYVSPGEHISSGPANIVSVSVSSDDGCTVYINIPTTGLPFCSTGSTTPEDTTTTINPSSTTSSPTTTAKTSTTTAKTTTTTAKTTTTTAKTTTTTAKTTTTTAKTTTTTAKTTTTTAKTTTTTAKTTTTTAKTTTTTAKTTTTTAKTTTTTAKTTTTTAKTTSTTAKTTTTTAKTTTSTAKTTTTTGKTTTSTSKSTTTTGKTPTTTSKVPTTTVKNPTTSTTNSTATTTTINSSSTSTTLPDGVTTTTVNSGTTTTTLTQPNFCVPGVSTTRAFGEDSTNRAADVCCKNCFPTPPCQGSGCEIPKISSPLDKGMSIYGFFFDNMFLNQVGVVTVQAADDKPRLVNVCRRPSSRPTSGKLSNCRRFVLNSKGSTSRKRADNTVAHIAGPRFDVIVNSPPGYEQFFNPQDAVNGRVFTSSSVIEGLGGEPDEYSVVSLEATAPVTGFITLYKPDQRNGASSGFGDKGFDFALVYPALLPQKSIVAFPINTHKEGIGVHKYSVAANWIRLADTECGNGKGVSGKIHYINADGNTVKTDPVSQPDCFRFDYAGHDDKLAVGKLLCLDLNDPTEPIVPAASQVSCPLGRRGQLLHLVKEEVETVGTAIFMPDAKSDTFIAGLGRYYYDCGFFGAGCNNFNSAFIIPVMAPQGGTLVAPAHILDGQVLVSEISNISNVASQLNLLFRAHDSEGFRLGNTTVDIPNLGVRHVVLNKVGNAGFVINNQTASAHLLPGGQETVTGLSVFYKKDSSNQKLLYAFGAQALAIGGKEQVLPFNTFIENKNSFTVQALAFPVTCDATVKSVIGGNLLTFPNGSTTKSFRVEPYGTVYENLAHLPKDQYGEVRLKCNRDQVIAQSYLQRGNDYTVAFPGRNGLLQN